MLASQYRRVVPHTGSPHLQAFSLCSWSLTWDSAHLAQVLLWQLDTWNAQHPAPSLKFLDLDSVFCIELCYCLHPECPPKLLCWRFGAQCSNIQREGFGEEIGSWGRWPRQQINPLWICNLNRLLGGSRNYRRWNPVERILLGSIPLWTISCPQPLPLFHPWLPSCNQGEQLCLLYPSIDPFLDIETDLKLPL